MPTIGINNQATGPALRRRRPAAAALVLALLLAGCVAGGQARAPEPARAPGGGLPQPQSESDSFFEAARTRQLLGVELRDFPPPQRPTGFDELPPDAPEFGFSVSERPLSGEKPKASYATRQVVRAAAPDGSAYEAYLGHDDPEQIAPGHGFVSTMANRRQRYGTHHGYAYSPQDVFIGRREGGRLKPTLFFRDVGSHTTAPHHLALDSRGRCHLTVADVNIYQGNRLDLYHAIGDPASGKWVAAWLIDRRGFTSWAHPWSASWGEKVHLLWNWCDVSVNKGAPGMGAFHVEWGPGGFGRKVRVVRGVVREWDAALDPRSGRLLIAYAEDDGVYVVSRPEGGRWTRAARLHPRIGKRCDVAVEATEGGAFVIRTGAESAREWLLRPL